MKSKRMDQQMSKDLLLETREVLISIINEMKAKGTSSVAST